MQTTPNELLTRFHDELGISLPRIALPGEELFTSEGSGYISKFLFGSQQTHERNFLVEGDLNEFIASECRGYFLAGYWGHGVSSYAFYYSRIDDWSHIFFRLPYGGVYSDVQEDKVLINRFLANYFTYEPKIKARAKSLIAVDSMGSGDYRIELHDGKTIVIEESFFRNANFQEKFDPLLGA